MPASGAASLFAPLLRLPISHLLLNLHQPTSPGSLELMAVAIPDK